MPSELLDRIAAEIHLKCPSRPTGDLCHCEQYADVVLTVPELKERLERLGEYENAICWNTSCLACSRTLDASIRDHERAEQAEAERDRLRARLTAVTVHANRAANSILPDTPAWTALADLRAAIYDPPAPEEAGQLVDWDLNGPATGRGRGSGAAGLAMQDTIHDHRHSPTRRRPMSTRAVSRGSWARLTDRQEAALTAAAIGVTQTVAARRYGISCRTLRRDQRAAMSRLGARTLTHAVALAANAGLLDQLHLTRRTLPSWPKRSEGGAE